MPRQRLLDDFSGEVGPTAALPLSRRPHPPALPGVWEVSEGHVVHPLLRPGQLRALPFQLDLARVGLDEDLLVVLPTGLGKTVIAALIAAESSVTPSAAANRLEPGILTTTLQYSV